MPFISFEDLLDSIEDLAVDVADRVMKIDKDLLLAVNPKFVAPQKPFVRLDYGDAIEYCRKNNIYKDPANKIFHEWGDVRKIHLI